MLLHGLCQNCSNEKIFVTCWFYSGFWWKYFHWKFGMNCAGDKNCPANWAKTKNLNEINHLRAGQNCPPAGQNCPMTERYSKTDRRSQSCMYRAQSLASISLFHHLMERMNWTAVQKFGWLFNFSGLDGGEKFSLGARMQGEVQGPCDGWRRRETSPILPQSNF